MITTPSILTTRLIWISQSNQWWRSCRNRIAPKRICGPSSGYDFLYRQGRDLPNESNFNPVVWPFNLGTMESFEPIELPLILPRKVSIQLTMQNERGRARTIGQTRIPWTQLLEGVEMKLTIQKLPAKLSQNDVILVDRPIEKAEFDVDRSIEIYRISSVIWSMTRTALKMALL